MSAMASVKRKCANSGEVSAKSRAGLPSKRRGMNPARREPDRAGAHHDLMAYVMQGGGVVLVKDE